MREREKGRENKNQPTKPPIHTHALSHSMRVLPSPPCFTKLQTHTLFLARTLILIAAAAASSSSFSLFSFSFSFSFWDTSKVYTLENFILTHVFKSFTLTRLLSFRFFFYNTPSIPPNLMRFFNICEI